MDISNCSWNFWTIYIIRIYFVFKSIWISASIIVSGYTKNDISQLLGFQQIHFETDTIVIYKKLGGNKNKIKTQVRLQHFAKSDEFLSNTLSSENFIFFWRQMQPKRLSSCIQMTDHGHRETQLKSSCMGPMWLKHVRIAINCNRAQKCFSLVLKNVNRCHSQKMVMHIHSRIKRKSTRCYTNSEVKWRSLG